MTLSTARFSCFAVLAVLLAGCANTQEAAAPPAAAATAQTSTPATPAATPAAAQAAAPDPEPDEPPLTPAEQRRHVISQCWMKVDQSGASLEAKAKLVDKCVADKQNPASAKASAKPSPKTVPKPSPKPSAKPAADAADKPKT